MAEILQQDEPMTIRAHEGREAPDAGVMLPPAHTDPAALGEELGSLRREVQTLRERVLELQRNAARHGSGEPPASGPVAVDASARQELLVEAERSARAGSWAWDLASDGVYWSDQMFRIMGYDPACDEASPAAFFERVHPEDRARVQQASLRCVETGIGEQVDFRLALPDGSLRYVTMNASMLFDESRRLRCSAGTLRDLTEDRLLKQGVQRSLQLLEEAQAIARMGHWTFEVATGSLEWSAGFYRVLGLEPSTPASQELLASRIVPEDRERFAALHEPGASFDWPRELEVRFTRPDGEVRSARTRTIAIADSSGRVIEYRGTWIDVTEQVLLSARLAQVNKTEAVARLARGIAHDFNNLLTVIAASLELWADDHDADVELADARQAVRSARVLTDRLLALGRRSHLSRRVVDPNELVARTAELLRRVVGEPVRLELRLGEGVPPFDVDPTLIEQMLINLVVNARDAVAPRGGTITLATGSVAEGAGPRQVELVVADDGPGMSAAIKDRIFEPFFTTKGEGGTGLGLPTVLGTVEQHGGTLDVESEPGRGSRFRVRLPAAERGARAEAAPGASGAAPRRGLEPHGAPAASLLAERRPAQALSEPDPGRS